MKRTIMADLVCAQCGKVFQRPLCQEKSRQKRGRAGPYCGRACVGRATRQSWHKRFAESIDVSAAQCWEWRGVLGRDGYGKFNISGRNYRAHRLSFAVHNGPIPKGLFVCHDCDNPACVNPDHLYAGTHADNMRDKRIRGRSRTPKGVANGRSKLTPAAVREIRRLTGAGVPQATVAARMHISPSSVSRVARREVWGHVP